MQEKVTLKTYALTFLFSAIAFIIGILIGIVVML